MKVESNKKIRYQKLTHREKIDRIIIAILVFQETCLKGLYCKEFCQNCGPDLQPASSLRNGPQTRGADHNENGSLVDSLTLCRQPH